MMGLTGLSTLTHRLEDLFVVFREDPSRLSGYERTFDLIFGNRRFHPGRTETNEIRKLRAGAGGPVLG